MVIALLFPAKYRHILQTVRNCTFSLRTLRESLRTLRLKFYRKERKGFRKGRKEIHKITVDEVLLPNSNPNEVEMQRMEHAKEFRIRSTTWTLLPMLCGKFLGTSYTKAPTKFWCPPRDTVLQNKKSPLKFGAVPQGYFPINE